MLKVTKTLPNATVGLDDAKRQWQCGEDAEDAILLGVTGEDDGNLLVAYGLDGWSPLTNPESGRYFSDSDVTPLVLLTAKELRERLGC